MEDLSGKQLGSYQVVAPLGEGGMAAVYKAYQPGMERYVALKILPRHFASDPEFVGRFEQEAKVLAKLQHPHILPVFDYGQADGYTYIVMPFLESGDLTDLLSSQPLPLAQIRRIISQLGDALDYAHSRDLVHRDVKPSNVLLDERGNCLLMDFGIAKIVGGTAKFTATGGFLGTPAYMSPEQGLGRKLDGRSDIYALGIMLYEMATGRVPYKAETPMAVVVKHINDPMPLPRQVNPALPEAVERVILKALAKEPEDRYATAGDMVRALQAAIPETTLDKTIPVDEEATMISPAGPTVESREQETVQAVAVKKPARLNPGWILAAVAVTIIVIGAGIFFATRGGKEEVDTAAVVPTPEQAQAGTAAPVEVAPEVTFTATPGPTTVIDTDPTSYDNFDNPAFDGEWDTDLWQFEWAEDADKCEVGQEDGRLRFSCTEPGGFPLNALNYQETTLEVFNFLEARLMLDGEMETSHTNVTISLKAASWGIECGLLGHPDEDMAQSFCQIFSGDKNTYWTEGPAVAYDTWHVVRIESNPESAELSFFIDDQQFDTYTPAEVEALQEAEYGITLSVWLEDGTLATGYFDDVRIGRFEPVVASQPTTPPSPSDTPPPTPTPTIALEAAPIYDDFDNPTFDGMWDAARWGLDDADKCEVSQQEGFLSFSCTKPTGSSLNALRYEVATFEEFNIVEARLMFDGEMQTNEGNVAIIFGTTLGEKWWDAGCGLYGHTQKPTAQSHCVVFSGDNREYSIDGPGVAYDTWHVVRIELNPESAELRFFIDGQPVGTHTPADAEALKTAEFVIYLQVWLGDGTLTTAHFDEVRIGRTEP